MKFSVIIPVYNKADTIAASINSILAQEYTDYEIIVVDDGSTDDLTSALSSFADRITVIHQENGGVSVARNTGIDAARGEFVCFLDADDLWQPHHLTTLSNMMKQYPMSRYFITAHTTVESDGKERCSAAFLQDRDPVFSCEDFIGLMNRTSYSLVHTNSVCIQKQLLDEYAIRFAQGIRIGEDTDVWYRAALRDAVVLSQESTTCYRREFSTATSTSFYTDDWVFASRRDEIVSDPTVKNGVKNSVSELCDRYYLTGAREYMKKKDRAHAKVLLQHVRQRSGKRYILTRLLVALPYAVCMRLLP